MTIAPARLDASTPEVAAMRATFETQHRLSRTTPAPTHAERLARLDTLRRMVTKHQDAIADAIAQDFGHRSRHETKLLELVVVVSGIDHARRHLKRWMKPRRAGMHWLLRPASAEIVPQPLGVVGIVAPWNYPFQLGVAPLVNALAAGNRALLKPSELTPRLSELLQRLVAESFDPAVVAVVTGGPEVAAAFTRLPFDHLLFTGSTRVGHEVMKAAAEHLTPVTLELGGKSPAIVHADYPMEKAIARVLYSKTVNAGQTCVATDYVLVPKGRSEEVVRLAREVVARTYPTLAENPDFTAIVNDRHYGRLRHLVDDAARKGARIVEINPAGEALDPAKRKFAPTLILDPTDAMQVMQEEIFGPVLPVVEYGTLDEALAYVNARPRPLALYYFDHDRRRADDVLARTTSGGAVVNDVMLHVGVDDLPFGGVGPSGMGAYHGERGFETFSHLKGVLRQARWNGTALLDAPYGTTLDRAIRFLLGR